MFKGCSLVPLFIYQPPWSNPFKYFNHIYSFRYHFSHCKCELSLTLLTKMGDDKHCYCSFSKLGLCRCWKMHRKDYIFSQNRFIAHCLPHLWPLLHLLAISSKISSFYNEKVPDILIAAHVNSFVSRDIWVEKRAMAYFMKTLFVPYSLCHSWFWNSELVFLGSVIQISSEGRHTVCHNKDFQN